MGNGGRETMNRLLTFAAVVVLSPVILAVAVYAAWECNKSVLVYMGDDE